MMLSEYKRTTNTPAAAIYKAWSAPAGWATWDKSVKEVQFVGEARLGATGKLTPTKGPASTFSILSIVENKSFTNASKLPGGRINFDHEIRTVGAGREVHVSVFVSGPLTFLWGRVLRKDLALAAQESVDGLLDMLEQ